MEITFIDYIMNLIENFVQVIDHWGHMPRDASLHQSSDASSSDQVPMQASFPYQVTPSRKHQLALTIKFVGIPLASSILGYPFQR